MRGHDPNAIAPVGHYRRRPLFRDIFKQEYARQRVVEPPAEPADNDNIDVSAKPLEQGLDRELRVGVVLDRGYYQLVELVELVRQQLCPVELVEVAEQQLGSEAKPSRGQITAVGGDYVRVIGQRQSQLVKAVREYLSSGENHGFRFIFVYLCCIHSTFLLLFFAHVNIILYFRSCAYF